VALARIAALAAGPDTPAAQLAERTVLLFLLGPSAVFLAAAYSEALFLAFALPAWLAAKRGRWWTAALLAACASTTRITGLCLAAALVVEFVTARDGRRRLSAAPSLALPFLPVLAYFAYLHGLTGDWMRWKHVQEQGWYRVSVWPWQGLQHSLDGVNSGFFTADGAWMFRVEIIAAFVGLALLVVLLRQRRWSESCYVGLQLTMLTTSYWWQAIPRNELTWWPLWVTLAAWSLRRPAVFAWYLAIAPAFMITFTLVFVNGRWAG
jgi:Gpi18-like mannosyltransferase